MPQIPIVRDASEMRMVAFAVAVCFSIYFGFTGHSVKTALLPFFKKRFWIIFCLVSRPLCGVCVISRNPHAPLL